jgi:exodeoxyribonuclease VII large subunit
MASLLDTVTEAAPSVSQVAQRITGALRAMGGGWVEGEVRSITRHRSGHVYLTLADESASLDACIWRGSVRRCEPLPARGDLVQAHFERVGFYAPYGKTSLIVERLRPTGEGELLRRRAETLARLRAEGLCDPARRKALPTFPRVVGVVAGHDAHAKADVVRQLRQRWPPQAIVFHPAAMQGVQAVGSIIDALGRLQTIDGVDVIIVARGGGSVADLVAFDDERLCRAIFACSVPVITSIGHTKDRPNCDLVAAAFAPVPAKAAEHAIAHSADELLAELDRHVRVLDAVPAALRRRDEQIAALLHHLRVGQRVAELAAGVRAAGELLASRAEIAHRRRALDMAATARALDAVARALSGRAALDTLRDALHAAIGHALASQRGVLDRAADGLDGIARRIPRPEALEVLGAHLGHAAGRVRDKRRDYGRALDRLDTESGRHPRRRLAGQRAELVAEAERLGRAGQRGLTRARERTAHLGAVLDARDARRRGWVLACDEHGPAVTAVAGLTPGEGLRLRFADGSARATIDGITAEGEAT